MLAFMGDVHGKMVAFRTHAHDLLHIPEVKALIQVGDFWASEKTIEQIRKLPPLSIPTYFIDGNHEDYNYLEQYMGTEVVEIAPNLFYVPRGTVLELDGRKIGFMGGAASVDKARRTPGHDWWDRENIRDEEMRRMDDVESVDILVTHVPPQSVIKHNFDQMKLKLVFEFGLPITWTDPNAVKIEALWQRLGCPRLICGHMHRRINDGPVRILTELEVIVE